MPGILALDLSGDSSRALTGESMSEAAPLSLIPSLSLTHTLFHTHTHTHTHPTFLPQFHIFHLPPSFSSSPFNSTYVGGADKNAVVFDKDSGKIVATLKGHSKKVTCAVYHPREVSTDLPLATKMSQKSMRPFYCAVCLSVCCLGCWCNCFS